MKEFQPFLLVCLGLAGLDLAMGVAVMSVDIGAEWMKVAVVSVSFRILYYFKLILMTERFVLESN